MDKIEKKKMGLFFFMGLLHLKLNELWLNNINNERPELHDSVRWVLQVLTSLYEYNWLEEMIVTPRS